jgi:hypothetical protein
MAGNEERDGIPGQGLSDGSRCAGSAQDFGETAVGPGLSRRDQPGGFINLPGKTILLSYVKDNVSEILNVSFLVPAYPLDDLADFWGRSGCLARPGASGDPGFRQLQRALG